MNNNILIILPSDQPGGAENILKQVHNYFQKQNRKISIIILGKKTCDYWKEGNNTHIFYCKNIYHLIKSLHFIKKHSNKHIIFSSHGKVNCLTSLVISIGLLDKKYFICRESTMVFERFCGIKLLVYKILYRILYKNPDLIICQSEAMKNALQKSVPTLPEDKVVVIKNPLDEKFFSETNNNFEIADKFSPYILSIGRLIKEKGYDLLIKAFKKVQNELPENMSLVILGEGEERENLENLSRLLNLEKKTYFLGHKKEVLPYIKGADICVVSSRIEGFPNVLLQMMSQNTKVISTLCAGGIEQIPGILLSPIEDIEFLSTQIVKSYKSCSKNNRKIFDEYLEQCKITNFITEIEKNLNCNL